MDKLLCTPLVFGPTAEQDSGVFGYSGYQRNYPWQHGNWVSTSAIVQARGFDSAGNMQWIGLGAGADGSGRVPWGNRLAKPAVRAMSAAAPAGYMGTFI